MRPITIDRTHGGAAEPGVLDFSANLNPLGPPSAAITALRNAEHRLATYPEPRVPPLRAALARYVGVKPTEVLAGNGSTQLIYLVARTLGITSPFVSIPTFSEIANSLIAAGLAPQPIFLREREGFLPAQGDIDEAIRLGADAIFIGRPNSPTGSMLSLEAARQIAERCAARRCRCIFDDAFIDFVGEGYSAIRLLADLQNVIVIRSLTKMFAIPGIRLGYLAASESLVAKLESALEPWAVGGVAEEVGLACLDSAAEFCRRTRTLVATEREHLMIGLSQLPSISVFHSVANFLMLRVTESAPGAFARSMLANRIMVRDLSALPGCGPGLYRIAIRSRAENDKLLDAAAEFSENRRL